jgi:phenylacetic acid degradation operon negative regulatory protein
MRATRDEIDSRPGSTTSLLLTVIGSALREHGRWLPSSAFVALMEVIDVPAGRTRTALTRLKHKGVLVSEPRDGVAGYALADDAVPMLERGDARIYQPRFMEEDERWFVLSFSVPEENRDLRHQLKRRLTWIGCGSVAGALWIGPAYLVDEAEDIVEDLGLVGRVTIFMVDELRGATAPQEAIPRWWDLDTLRALHDDFLREHEGSLAAFESDPSPRNAFRIWVRALDAWRPIPYLDPGLPLSLLPNDWPGARSVPIFLQLRDVLGARAGEYIQTVVGGDQTPVGTASEELV